MFMKDRGEEESEGRSGDQRVIGKMTPPQSEPSLICRYTTRLVGHQTCRAAACGSQWPAPAQALHSVFGRLAREERERFFAVTADLLAQLIDAAIDNLASKLAEEFLVVALVCALFLWHVRSALVAIVTLPLGVLAAFLVMRLQGVDANIMSLGGIAIAIGAMVDAAIVMIENAHKKIERWTAELPNLHVVWGRAEEQPLETYGVAVAKALADPPVAAEWCLPLVCEGGAVVLWVGPTVEPERVAAAAGRIAGSVEPGPEGLLVIRKTGATPPGFPRRTGMARKRPLA